MGSNRREAQAINMGSAGGPTTGSRATLAIWAHAPKSLRCLERGELSASSLGEILENDEDNSLKQAWLGKMELQAFSPVSVGVYVFNQELMHKERLR
jgi:hypothetical protein